MVSVIAFYSDVLRSNPTGVNIVHYVKLVEENENECLLRESNVRTAAAAATTTATLQSEDENWDTFVRRDGILIDNILTEDEDEGGNGVDDDDTERPCVSMFDPALRVLGRGSFGRVSCFSTFHKF